MNAQLDHVDPALGDTTAATQTVRLVVLASGNGSNLQALIDACGRQISGDVVLVVSDQPDAKALRRAERAGIAHQVIAKLPGESRRDVDQRLADRVAAADPDWIILAGWMRLLSSTFLDRFADHVVNLHPALPGEYPGLHSIERAYADAVAGRRDYTGLMVHLVPDEAIDDGPVLAMTEVPIFPDDTLEQLADRMHLAEHDLLVRTVAQLPPVSRVTPVADHPAAVPFSPGRTDQAAHP